MIHEKIQTQNSLADLSNFAKSHLSIQVSLDGFSYCVFDKDLVDVVLLKRFEFGTRAQNPEELLRNVKEIFLLEPFLNEKFETVNVSHLNNLSVLVPNNFYDNEYLSDYLKYTVKVLNSDSISVENIESFGAKNVYISFKNIDEYLQSVYGPFDRFHSSTILINSLAKYFTNITKKYFFVNVTKHNLEIIYIQNGKINLYNSFLFYTKEDFIYYVLFTMEQLGLDPEEQTITFIGEIEKESALYNITYQYVRFVEFLDINNFSLSEDFYETNQHIQKHHFFELLNQF